MVLGCSCLLGTDVGLWNQHILVLGCVRLWGSASLWFFKLQHICNYQHMAQTHTGSLIFLAGLSCSPITHMHVYRTAQISYFFALFEKYVALCIKKTKIVIWSQPGNENPVCICAFVCESHYHNLQPIKTAWEMQHWWFWLPCALWGIGVKKKNTRPNKESPYGGTGARRVGWESGEAFHLVSFVWVKMSNENKQRKRISIILQ